MPPSCCASCCVFVCVCLCAQVEHVEETHPPTRENLIKLLAAVDKRDKYRFFVKPVTIEQVRAEAASTTCAKPPAARLSRSEAGCSVGAAACLPAFMHGGCGRFINTAMAPEQTVCARQVAHAACRERRRRLTRLCVVSVCVCVSATAHVHACQHTSSGPWLL